MNRPIHMALWVLLFSACSESSLLVDPAGGELSESSTNSPDDPRTTSTGDPTPPTPSSCQSDITVPPDFEGGDEPSTMGEDSCPTSTVRDFLGGWWQVSPPTGLRQCKQGEVKVFLTGSSYVMVEGDVVERSDFVKEMQATDFATAQGLISCWDGEDDLLDELYTNAKVKGCENAQAAGLNLSQVYIKGFAKGTIHRRHNEHEGGTGYDYRVQKMYRTDHGTLLSTCEEFMAGRQK